MDLLNLIERTVCFDDLSQRIRRRERPFSCLACEEALTPHRLAVLPALDGYLHCNGCYERLSHQLADRPFAGGYLVHLIDRHGIDGYAFSHGATLTVRAVCYNHVAGYFLVKQSLCDCGVGYTTLPLPKDVNVFDEPQVLAYEAQHAYGETTINRLFHPLLLFVQFGNLEGEHHDLLNPLWEKGGSANPIHQDAAPPPKPSPCNRKERTLFLPGKTYTLCEDTYGDLGVGCHYGYVHVTVSLTVDAEGYHFFPDEKHWPIGSFTEMPFDEMKALLQPHVTGVYGISHSACDMDELVCKLKDTDLYLFQNPAL